MSAPAVVRPLQIGPYTSVTPVVLAPMAGITNPGFRRLCREQGAGFYVCEMITSRGLVEENPLTFRMIAFDADERPRSMQLYGVDPAAMGRAVGNGDTHGSTPCVPSLAAIIRKLPPRVRFVGLELPLGLMIVFWTVPADVPSLCQN